MMYATRGRGRKFVMFWRGTAPPVFRPDANVYVARRGTETVIECTFPLELVRNAPDEGGCIEVAAVELHAKRA